MLARPPRPRALLSWFQASGAAAFLLLRNTKHRREEAAAPASGGQHRASPFGAAPNSVNRAPSLPSCRDRSANRTARDYGADLGRSRKLVSPAIAVEIQTEQDADAYNGEHRLWTRKTRVLVPRCRRGSTEQLRGDSLIGIRFGKPQHDFLPTRRSALRFFESLPIAAEETGAGLQNAMPRHRAGLAARTRHMAIGNPRVCRVSVSFQ